MKRLYVVALALVLAGCGGDPPSAAPPSPSPSATRTTPAAPVMPEGAKENSEEGAKAFVKYYIRTVNYTQSTGHTQPFASMTQPDCDSCKSFVGRINEIYMNGGSIEGGSWQIRHMVALQPAAPQWLVSASCTFEPQTIRYLNRSATNFRAGRSRLNLTLTFDGEWSVVRVVRT